MFLVSLTYTAPLNEVDKYLSQHVEYLDKQYELGHFLLSGRKVPREGGVILSSVTSKEKLNSILASDPFFKYRLAEYHITEIVPTKACSKLGFLIENQTSSNR